MAARRSTATLVATTTHGALTLSADGSFTYTPAANFNGTDSFTYKANDGTADSNVATVRITVNAVNDAPSAVDDAYAATEDQPLTVAAPGVLANDTDVEGGTLSAVLVTGPANGTIALNADGSFTYTPNANFNGSDSFTYKANDGSADSSAATVTITVAAVNDAPVATADNYSTNEDGVLGIAAPGVLSNDTDVEHSALTAVLGSGPAHGTLTLNADGSFLYTPNANFNGTDSFTYTASDGSAASDPATVTITVNAVNDAPVAVDDAAATSEDTAVTGNVLANDTDVDAGTTLTATLVANPAHGTVTLNANGSFTYTPSANFNGSDSFTYKANDGIADSNVATVTIAVTAVDDAPVAVDDAVATDEDTPVSGNVLTNDTDVDAGTTLTATLVANASHGTVTLSANGSFTYTPNADFNGSDSFTYKASAGTTESNVATVTITIAAVNDAPVAGNDSATTNEDTAVTIAVLTNDTDVDGDVLAVTSASTPLHGSAVANPDGTITYTPAANFNGADTFTYTIGDGHGGSATASVTVTVAAVNDAPVAADDSYSTDEDTVLTIAAPGVLSNDADVDSPTLTAAVVNGPAHGTVTLNANGSFIYTPNANFNGSDSFTYKASDGLADSNVATATITVNAVADAPVANGDSYSTDEDTLLTIAAPGILANDTNIDGGALTAVLVSGPANGTLQLNADGSFSYQPNANLNGSDSFTYKVTNGAVESSVATVGITVNATNDAPLAVADNYTAIEDQPLNVPAPGVLGNDTDVEHGTLTATLVSGPASGTLTLSADGSFTYTPAADFNGSDSFAYKTSDGTDESSPVTVTIAVTSVNDVPVATDDNYGTNEDGLLAIAAPGLLGNDLDVEHSPLSAIVVNGPTHGTLTVNADGSFSYAPSANFSGSDSFTYKASDGTADSNVATVTITVNAVNDAPVAASDSYTTAEDTAITIAAPGVLANDTDVDSTALTAALVGAPAHGTLTLNPDGSFTYVPSANFNGSDSFTYKASDGAADSNIATVTIAVTEVDDAPVAVDDAVATSEDTPVSGNVLANDSDVDGTAELTATLVANAAHGNVALNANGSFTYTPTANFSGSDSFTYKASYGSAQSNVATVTIAVAAVNHAPVAGNDIATTNEDTAVTIAVLTNDTDVDGDALTVAAANAPLHGAAVANANGTITYTPAANYNGADTFTYTVSDGHGGSATGTVSVMIAAVNDAPVATGDAATTAEDTPVSIAVLANDTDVDGDSLSVTTVSVPAHGSAAANLDGTITYTPAANYNGTDTFTYAISDGHGGTSGATVTVTVTGVNDAPVAANDAATTTEDTPVNITVLANDTDVDGDSLSVTSVSLPAHGAAAINLDGTIRYTPAANYNGSDVFTYMIGDGHGGTATGTVNVTVTAVNDAPVAANDSYSTDEETVLTIAAPGVLANDTDVDHDALTAIVMSGPAHGTVTLNANGSFTYTPAANYTGGDSFTYKASDGTLDSPVATVAIAVAAVNHAPIAVADAATTAEDTAVTIAVLANDTDRDDDALSVGSVGAPLHGTVVIAGQQVTYTPAANYNGADTFTYVVTDGHGGSGTGTVNVTITAVNDAPVAGNDSYSTPEDAALTIAAPGVLANDTDVDSTTLTAALVSGPANGTLTFNANGSFSYTPNADFNGSDSFTYRANDGALNSQLATVTITVTPVNDAPSASDQSVAAHLDTPVAVGLTAWDVDGDPLTYRVTANVAHGVLTGTAPNLVYIPYAGFSGMDTFTFVANDGTVDSNVATVTIRIMSGMNRPPEAEDQWIFIDEDTPSDAPLLASDPDEGDTLTYTIVTQPSHGTLTGVAPNLVYTPDADFNGWDYFTFIASDGTFDSNEASVNFWIWEVNDPPVAHDLQVEAGDDQPVTAPLPVTDAENDWLYYEVESGPTNGTVTIDPESGAFTYTPASSTPAYDYFTYSAFDWQTQGNVATVEINPQLRP